MKKRYVSLIAVLAFILGALFNSPIDSVAMMLKTEKKIECATKNICLGELVNKVFGLYESDPLGGLDSIFCGIPNDNGNIEYIFVKDIVAGETCRRENYSLTYTTEFTRTVIQVRGGTITQIRRGPRHILDL